MALIKVPKEMGSTPGIVDNSNATAITIDSSENATFAGAISVTGQTIISSDALVSTPSTYYDDIVVQNSASGTGAGMTVLVNATNGFGGLKFGDSTNSNQFGIGFDANANAGFLDVLGAQALTIDSNRNVLLGTTNTAAGAGNTNAGVSIRGGSDNRSFFSANSNYPMHLNRNTNDGEILWFAKNGGAVGSAGTTTSAGGTRFAIGGVGDPGIIFAGTGVFPAIQITASDTTIDLGSGTYRWRDIFLSGGVNFSVNANASGMTSETLDDYEEGTFTATLKGGSSGTLTATAAEYTKIGNTVHCRIAFINVNTTGYSGHLRVEGLPFPMGNSQLRNVCTPAMYRIGAFTADYVVGLLESSTHVNFYGVKSANTWNTVAHDAGGGRYLEFNVTYNTNS